MKKLWCSFKKIRIIFTNICQILYIIWGFGELNRETTYTLIMVIQKAHSFRDFVKFELLLKEIHQGVWPVADDEKKIYVYKSRKNDISLISQNLQ